jgi:glycosyltransferase involved in cell wall biosynthesis
MSEQIEISIVTPSFNQGRFLVQTIESVLSQEGDFRIDYTVADGGSTDDSVGIIKKYEHLVKAERYPFKCQGIGYRWWSRKDNGQSAAVNEGLKVSTGEVIGWLNSDDTYAPGALNAVARFFREHPDVDMVYGRGAHTDEGGVIVEWVPTRPFDLKSLLRQNFLPQPAVFFRKTLIDKIGFLNENLHFCMDYDYWLRAARKTDPAYLERHLANLRLHGDTKTLSKRLEVYEETIALLKRKFRFVPGEWIYGWSKAKANQRSRRGGLINETLFLIDFFQLFVSKYLQINKRLPLREFFSWSLRLNELYKIRSRRP